MVFYLFSQLFSYSLSLSNDCLSIWLYHILQDNTYKSQKSVWINKKSIANAMLFSLCRWRDFLLSYRTVHRTVLPNFYGFALKFGTTSSSLSLYLKTKAPKNGASFLWRRWRDLNPWNGVRRLHDFQSCSFGQLGHICILF